MATKSKTIAADTKATVTPVETKAVAADTTTGTKAAAKKPVETKAVEANAETRTAEAKPAAKKTTSKKETTTAKTAAKKTTSKKETTTTKKTTAKKAVEPSVSYVLQYGGREVVTSDILETVKKIWVEKFQGKLEEIKTIELYIKPEENKAYFVVNGLSNGDYFVEL